MARNEIVVAFVASYDSAILAIRRGFPSWESARKEAVKLNLSTNYTCCGHDGAWNVFHEWELDYI